jgi:L-asparaginase
MEVKRIDLEMASPSKPRGSVMLIYTGGTLGMVHDASGMLVPFDFSLILERLPALKTFQLAMTVLSIDPPIDSSNVGVAHWQTLAEIIYQHHDAYDGFVVLHGTDTMAFTASALSFMLQGLQKPVILTGAQLPISSPRSDAREHLITSLEIATAKKDGQALVPEVCIYFNYALLRGNRAKKVESAFFDAFQSENYPPLAKAGIQIEYNHPAILVPRGQLQLIASFDTNVTILKLFPGMSEAVLEGIISVPGLRGMVMETYGSGNAPTDPRFLKQLEQAIAKGITILNVSQCVGGKVMQGKYSTSSRLQEIGVLGGADMTTEAAITKLMLVLGSENSAAHIKESLAQSISGEITL